MTYKGFFILLLIVVVLGLIIITDIKWDPVENVYKAYYIFLSIIVSVSIIIFSIFPGAHIKASKEKNDSGKKKRQVRLQDKNQISIGKR